MATDVLELRSLLARKVGQSPSTREKSATGESASAERVRRSSTVAVRSNWKSPALHLASAPISDRLQSHCQGPRYSRPLAGSAPSLQAGRAAPSISTCFDSRSKRSVPSPRTKKESEQAVSRVQAVLRNLRSSTT